MSAKHNGMDAAGGQLHMTYNLAAISLAREKPQGGVPARNGVALSAIIFSVINITPVCAG